MRRLVFATVLFALPAAAALALPAEDHWSSDLDPAAVETMTRAHALIEAGNPAEAIALLAALAKSAPAVADVFNLLGFAHRKAGDLAISGAHYERALYLDPDHLGALEYQGELYLALGKPELAAANLARLETLCALPCEEREELAEAIRDWRAAD